MQSMTSMMVLKLQPFLMSSLLIQMLWQRLIFRSLRAFRMIWLSLSPSLNCLSYGEVEAQVSQMRFRNCKPIQNSQRYGHSAYSCSRRVEGTLATWMLVSQNSSIILLCWMIVAMSSLMSGTMMPPCYLAILKLAMFGTLASRPLMVLKSGVLLRERKKRERYSNGLPLKGAQKPISRSYSQNQGHCWDSASLSSWFCPAQYGWTQDSSAALTTSTLECIFPCRPMIFLMHSSAPTNYSSISGRLMQFSLRLQKSSVVLVMNTFLSERMSCRWSQNLQMNLKLSSRLPMTYSCRWVGSGSMFGLRQQKETQEKCIDRSLSYRQLYRMSSSMDSQKLLPSRFSSRSVMLTFSWNQLRLALGGGTADATRLTLRNLNLKSRQMSEAMMDDSLQWLGSLPFSCLATQMSRGSSLPASSRSCILLLRQLARSLPFLLASWGPKQALAMRSTYSLYNLRAMLQCRGQTNRSLHNQ